MALKPELLGQMEIERDAWGNMCRAFEVITHQSVNEIPCQPLVAMIRLWGEELAVLRREQGDEGVAFGRNSRKEQSSLLAGHGIVAPFSD